MNISNKQKIWNESDWKALEERIKKSALSSHSDDDACKIIIKEARKVMRKYTSSFFMVSRFLPKQKRDLVEVIYAAVRYPDEIVDTFKIPKEHKKILLDEWESNYIQALGLESIRESLNRGIHPFLTCFAKLVRDYNIPKEYYLSFIDAMRKDAYNTKYNTIDELIESYIYGSAIVVGYFLTYVYGAVHPSQFDKALKASRDLGVALQLTNFMRDVYEDTSNGRLYIPLELLKQKQIDFDNLMKPEFEEPLKEIVNDIVKIAEKYYILSDKGLDLFSADCRTAIKACIDVYSKLNELIFKNNNKLRERQSVSLLEKFITLPISKYWVIPANYIFR
jgi:phytoene synthase